MLKKRGYVVLPELQLSLHQVPCERCMSTLRLATREA
jgi:hypothetical protein